MGKCTSATHTYVNAPEPVMHITVLLLSHGLLFKPYYASCRHKANCSSVLNRTSPFTSSVIRIYRITVGGQALRLARSSPLALKVCLAAVIMYSTVYISGMNALSHFRAHRSYFIISVWLSYYDHEFRM